MKKLLYLIIFITIVFAIFSIFNRRKELPYNIEYATEEPIQQNLSKKEQIIINHYEYPEFKITKKAKYIIKAKLLSIKRYRNDEESKISPVDFALGWGKLSDEFYASHKDLKVWQEYRWYKSRVEDSYPLDFKYISDHLANTHIIPANDDIKDKVLNINKGSIIELTGFLVFVNKSDGWKWNSSLKRTDSGNGACELMYVENINIIEG